MRFAVSSANGLPTFDTCSAPPAHQTHLAAPRTLEPLPIITTPAAKQTTPAFSLPTFATHHTVTTLKPIITARGLDIKQHNTHPLFASYHIITSHCTAKMANMDIDFTRRNKKPRLLTDSERDKLDEFVDSIHYSSR